MAAGTTALALEKELKYYQDHLDELLQHYEGKFVLIKGEQLVGAFDDPRDAYEEGVKRFGNTPFLIKRVQKEEHEEQIPALNLGILHAGL